MRRALDFLGITRPKGSPRPKLLSTVIEGLGVGLLVLGVAVIAGNVEVGGSGHIWIGGVLILIGVACFVTEGLMGTRAKDNESPQ